MQGYGETSFYLDQTKQDGTLKGHWIQVMRKKDL